MTARKSTAFAVAAPRFTKKGRAYRLDGESVPSVTTVIGQLDKPALVNWAARETAAFADEHWDRLSKMRSADRIKELEQARYHTNRKAVTKGHRIHALGERLAQTGDVEEVPAEILPQVEGYARFLDKWEVETIATELPVANSEYRYAGTLDLLCHIPKVGNVLLDVKTGKGVYREVALQTAAYRYADLCLWPSTVTGPRGGKKLEHTERDMPTVDACYVAHVVGDDVEFRPLQADESVWEVFLYLVEVWESWEKRTGWDFRKEESFNPVVLDAVWPEQVDTAEKVPF